MRAPPRSTRVRHRPRGMALVWVSICMIVMVGFVGLALDMGYGALVGGQLQNAADAAALAGARIVAVAPTGARTAAQDIASRNKAAGAAVQIDTTADVSVGTYSTSTRTLTAGTANPNAVRVTVRRTTAVAAGPVQLFFGGVFGVPSLNMTRTATAMVETQYSPALVVLDPTGGCALDVGGGGVLTALGGSIQVNSTAATAACFSGTATSQAQYLNTTGGVSGAAHFSGVINTNVPPIPDPLAGLPPPPRGAPLGSVNVGTHQSITLNPGYYNGGINVQGSLTLNPGIYIVGGSGFGANSQANITGTGVMIYLTDGASISMSSSNVTMTISPPDPTRDTFVGADVYEGVSIFQDRTDTTMATLPLSGSFNLSGTLYFPSAEMRVTAGGSQTGVRLIVYDLTMRGSSALNLLAPLNMTNTGKPYLVE